ncbi:MAG TPA: pitrilysin family protein [Bacteroidales bacterium]|nr:pitrilysin family protein [Bacteroidales bacterium]
MKKSFKILILLALVIFTGCSKKNNVNLSLPYESYKLNNGLTVILNEDKSDPITSFVILYHVGSNREVQGRTGFAHLFEHMMFQRSENVGEDQFFKTIDGLGGEFNGGTGNDMTIYYEVVPKNGLETCMWMESDRLGYLTNTITPSSFVNQQNVVQNEKRQGEDNMPYGFTDYVIAKNLYPAGHPYSWEVIGEMEDLKNATIQDVKDFHNKFYVPNNATIVVSGDFVADSVKKLVEKYFGEIPAGNPVEDLKPIQVTLSQTKKLYHEDSFAKAPQYTMVYPVPQQYTKEAHALDVLAQLLGTGKKSPMYKVLVKDRKLTSNVSVYDMSQELSGEFRIRTTANPSTDLKDVEKAIFEAFNKFETEGFTEKDLERTKAKLETQFYEMMSSVMYKSFLLAQYNELAGSPSYVTEELKQMMAVTSQDVWDVYNKYIKGKNYVSTSFVPKGQVNLVAEGSVNAGIVEEDIKNATEMTAAPETKEEAIVKTPSKIDRSVAPKPGPDPVVNIPAIWTSDAANGMKIYGIEQHELPMVQYSIVISGGHMLDDISKPGVARFTAQMLNEGTKNKTPEDLEEAIDMLGASIRVSGSDEDISIDVTTLARNFEKSVEIVKEMLLEPRWDEEQFGLNKTKIINNLKRNKANPNYLANRTLTSLIIGKDNVLSADASGTVESVEAITMDDLKAFYEKNFSPSISKLLVVGDLDKARVDAAFKGLEETWKAKDVAMPTFTFAPVPEKSSINFVDVPGSKQSVIAIGNLSIPRNNADFYHAEVANFMLGGGINGRFFMTLREEKGYTYGAYSSFYGMKDYGMFRASSSVRSDATLDAMKIFRDLMVDYRKGVSQADVDFTKASLLRANARRFETLWSLQDMLNTMTSYDLPSDYIKQEEEYLQGLTLEQVNETVQKYIDPMRMYYVVVGDAATQMKDLSKIGFGAPLLLK